VALPEFAAIGEEVAKLTTTGSHPGFFMGQKRCARACSKPVSTDSVARSEHQLQPRQQSGRAEPS
jgi:hypothetical protein